MFDLDIALVLRNSLLLQFFVILLLPDHAAVALHRNLWSAWRRIQGPLLEKKPPKKGSRFWEIDMTKFEP